MKIAIVFGLCMVQKLLFAQNLFVAKAANFGIDSVAEDTAKIYRLNEVVVSGTRSEKKTNEVGRSISLISKDAMNSSIYNSVSEILSQQEGMYIVGTGQNPGMVQSIFMRGAASNQTAIMIDEVRITDPSTPNDALDLSELSPAGDDRIEIVRGSHSTLYGSSAIGGVVSIFTEKNGRPGFNSDVDIEGGNFGKGTSVVSQNIFLDYTDPIGVYVNTELENSDTKGLDATVDTVTNPATFKHRDKDGFDKTDFGGKVGFRNERVDAYISYKKNHQFADLDKGAYTDDDNAALNFRRNLFTYGVSALLNDHWTIKFLGGYSDMTRITVDDSSVVDNIGNTDHTYSDGTWKGSMGTNELQANVHLGSVEAVVGGGQSKETMTTKTFLYAGSDFGAFESSSDLDTLHLHAYTKYVFGQLELQGNIINDALRPLSLVLGARLNDHSAYGTNSTYEINPSFKIGNGSLLYASYSAGFNAPSLYELYDPDLYYTSDITRGNKSLKPETSSSYELGIKQVIGNASTGISYFSEVTRNLIEDVYLWDKNIPIDSLGSDPFRDDFRGDTYLNVGEQTTHGFEFFLVSEISSRITMSGNFSLVSGKLRYDPSAINAPQNEGNHVQLYSNGSFLTGDVTTIGLVRRPNTANIRAAYQATDQLSLRIDVRYAGPRDDVFYDSNLGPYGALAAVRVAAYTLTDFSQDFIWSKALTIRGRIENIFNIKYSEINGFTTRGRGVYIALRYSGQPF
ncbi:MAG TPA: TonB-dependent receptor [Bacteroidota bacterium]|nr:TonB-dependent receptor [Bacteroidota bacterium]